MTFLLELYFVFFWMDLFNFGGGYAMISLMQNELITRGWMTTSQFLDMIAIAQMTPGAFAINAATFVGYETYGMLGSWVATLAIPTPTIILIFLIYPWLERNKSHHRIQTGFYVIRAIVVALIFSAVISVAKSTFLRVDESFVKLIQSGENIASLFNLSAILMFVVSLLALMKFKIHPIIVILGSGVVGVIWFMLFPQLF